MNFTSLIEALIKAGATPEMILAAVKSQEEEALHKKEQNRQRQIKSRSKKSLNNNNRVTVTSNPVTTQVPLSHQKVSPLVPPSDGFPHPSLTPPYNPPIQKLGDSYFQKCFEFLESKFPNIATANLSPIHEWQKAGYDFETQVKPTIESASAREIKLTSLSYITKSLEGLTEKKIKPAPAKEIPITLTAEQVEAIREKNRKFGIYT